MYIICKTVKNVENLKAIAVDDLNTKSTKRLNHMALIDVSSIEFLTKDFLSKYISVVIKRARANIILGSYRLMDWANLPVNV